MVAIPKFNKFLVHCGLALYSCPLDMIVRAFRGDATFQDLDKSMERLAETHGDVWFLRTGSVAGHTLGTSVMHLTFRRFSSSGSHLCCEHSQADVSAHTRTDPGGKKPMDTSKIPASEFCSSQVL
jgi:hypothetical protein